jgi:two-component system, OmpR family, KDP operon response regulator KdpE
MAINVLIIDDDPELTDLLTMALRTQGLEVVKSRSGKEGIDLVHSLSPDVVILDLKKPETNIREVCKELRSFTQVPILVLSALDNPKMVAGALDSGADDYLVKPVPSGILVARINTLTRRVDMEKKHKKTSELKTEALPL